MFNNNNNMRVMIVDGYTDAADSLALLLTHWGLDVRVAYNGPDALAMARLYCPHIVLMELMLEGLDGYQLAKRLRQDTSENITLIALTGMGDETYRWRALNMGFHSFLVKPVEPEGIKRQLLRLALLTRQTTSLPKINRPLAFGRYEDDVCFRVPQAGPALAKWRP
jgi:DNA-binding response OmpR family regulator